MRWRAHLDCGVIVMGVCALPLGTALAKNPGSGMTEKRRYDGCKASAQDVVQAVSERDFRE